MGRFGREVGRWRLLSMKTRFWNRINSSSITLYCGSFSIGPPGYLRGEILWGLCEGSLFSSQSATHSRVLIASSLLPIRIHALSNVTQKLIFIPVSTLRAGKAAVARPKNGDVSTPE